MVSIMHSRNNYGENAQASFQAVLESLGEPAPVLVRSVVNFAPNDTASIDEALMVDEVLGLI